MRTHTTSVQKWGNSLAVRIPAAVAIDANIDINSIVKLVPSKGGFTVIPIKGTVSPIVPTPLKKLLKNVRPYRKNEIIDWGPPVGNEVW